jgi:predicted short-subunit dehydrogenase-like oxidoreductase (DUF2520 family)
MGTRARKTQSSFSGNGGIEDLAVTVVGPGRVGQSIGKLLAEAGIGIRYVAARSLQAARRAAQFIGSGTPVGLRGTALTDSPLILLTVSDAALGPLARDLAQGQDGWSGKVVLHTSGALPSAVLRPLRERGAHVGSLHPFQTIPTPTAGVRNLSGCFWGIEGDPEARAAAATLARALDGTPFRVRPEWKILYHAAAVLSCGAVVALLDQSARLLRAAGVPAGIVRPMLGRFAAETVSNFVSLGGHQALTGPAVRGDWQTIRQHLASLRRYAPEIVPAYTELTRAMVRLAAHRPPPRLFSERRRPARAD